MSRRALEGVKVVEYSHLISGPYCAKLMADMGAEVVKVEEPGVGDEARRTEPFLDDTPGPERSGLFLYLNTNKLGVTLNLKTPTGREIFRQLLADADILVENNPPGFLSELGLGYESLRKVNPRLVVTSITPFGQTGPYKGYKANYLNLYHIGGLGYLGGSPTPGTTPLKAGGRQADFMAAGHGAVGALMALLHQRATGVGQHVDISAMESIAANLELYLQMYTHWGTEVPRLGRLTIGPGALLPCRDGFIHFFVVEEAQWSRFLEVLGNPEWGQSDMFKGVMGRARNWDALGPLITGWTIERTKEEIVRACQANRVPVVAVNDMADLANSEHLAARGYFVEIEHSEAGKLRFPSAPYRCEKTPWQAVRSAPMLGQHNEEVYCGRLGYRRGDLVKLAEAGIV